MTNDIPQFAQKILVPIDFSNYSQNALTLALGLPDTEDAELHLLHVIPPGNLAIESASTINERNRQSTSKLHQCVPAETELERKIHRHVCEGLPHVVICNYAAEHAIDLIVMGTRGRGGVGHLLLGSVAERVLRQAPCPVLTLRSSDGQPGTSSATTSDVPTTIESSASPETTPALDLIQRASQLRATDIHLDPTDGEKYQVRFRIDGRLESYCELDQDIAEHLIHQLKNLARLDISDPFQPQEGRLQLPVNLSQFEARLTTAPVAGGQAIALRLFDRERVHLPLIELGFTEDSYESIQQILQNAEGLILVTGPAGSGKTTTVYSMLRTLRDHQQNIVSVEDPVEFESPFMRQMSVDSRHGITLTSGLRTMLRMDPDILFLGEIRDEEAAQITMRAASSGKNVISTLHTRDVASAVTTLRDLHLDNRSLAENVRGVVNQRLVRRLCKDCCNLKPVSDQLVTRFGELNIEPVTEVAVPRGCPQCRETGYRGRVGIFEVAVIDDALREAIARQASEQELREIMRSIGVKSIDYDALLKVLNGTTSYAEAMQVRCL